MLETHPGEIWHVQVEAGEYQVNTPGAGPKLSTIEQDEHLPDSGGMKL